MWAQILSQGQPGKQPSWPGDEISPPYLEVQPPRGADSVYLWRLQEPEIQNSTLGHYCQASVLSQSEVGIYLLCFLLIDLISG